MRFNCKRKELARTEQTEKKIEQTERISKFFTIRIDDVLRRRGRKQKDTKVFFFFLLKKSAGKYGGVSIYLKEITEAWRKLCMQSNFNGSNTFGARKICSRQGYFELVSVNHSARTGGKIEIYFRFSLT